MTKTQMTFDEFQATRIPRYGLGGQFVYVNDLVIEILPSGEFFLQIGNQEYVDYDLETLEGLLYSYAEKEGLLETLGTRVRDALIALLNAEQDRIGQSDGGPASMAIGEEFEKLVINATGLFRRALDAGK